MSLTLKALKSPENASGLKKCEGFVEKCGGRDLNPGISGDVSRDPLFSGLSYLVSFTSFSLPWVFLLIKPFFSMAPSSSLVFEVEKP